MRKYALQFYRSLFFKKTKIINEEKQYLIAICLIVDDKKYASYYEVYMKLI